MTVLRSRKTLSGVAPKPSLAFAPENVVVEPVTPAKNSELNPSSNNTSPSSSFQTHNRGHEIGFGSGDGSVMVSECGIVRRLSARLAKKVGLNDYIENVEVVSAEKKKVEGAALNGEFDSRTFGGRVSGVKLEFPSSGGVPDHFGIQPKMQDVGDSSVAEMVKENEKIKEGGSDVKETCVMEAVTSGSRKRRFSIEVKELGMESCAEDKVEKGFLNLRSGKRVVKRIETRNDAGSSGISLEGIEASKPSGEVMSGDTSSERMSEAKAEVDENGHWKEEITSCGGEKGKVKVVSETSDINVSAPMNYKLHDGTVSLGGQNQDAITSPNTKEVVKDDSSIAIETGMKTRSRLSTEEKGKMILGTRASSSSSTDAAQLKVKNENVNESSASGAEHPATNEALQDRVQVRDTNATVDGARNAHRERSLRFARRNASRFAHFSSQDELGGHARVVAGGENSLPEVNSSGVEDWPGPFSTAMKIIKDREGNRKGERHNASASKSEAAELKWIRKNKQSCKHQKQVPSLIELCLSVLSENADAVTSLDFVPDSLRHKICYYLCESRRMNSRFLELLVCGTPTEIRIWDCSWLSEELFTKTFEGCNVSKLMVLQFDLCGRCMSDDALKTALARSLNSLTALVAISLKGAYRLSDAGLCVLVSAAPSLKSIDISDCPLLTSEGIFYLASSLGLVLRELYLDNSQGIDAMHILPALQKLEKLEVLSVAGIQTVSDEFVSKFFSENGCRMKELVLADCKELTDSSLKVIGDTCSDLRAIDLMNLGKLTDVSMGHLANGCKAIETLKLCRNAFSDEAIAAYLDVRGASMKELLLNNMTQVSNHTALSLASNCRNLRRLDLSFCRNLTNEALGLIVDSCTCLEVLKLIGCTQVTNVFLDGHSNPQVKVIGLMMSLVLKNIDVPEFLQGPLRYSAT